MGRKVKKIRRAHPRPALAILSRKKTLYSTRRLIEAAKARSFRTRVIDVLRCNLALESGNPRLYHKGKEVRGIGVALPRIGASVTAAGLSVARQLEAMGVPLVNGASAIARSRDKLALASLTAWPTFTPDRRRPAWRWSWTRTLVTSRWSSTSRAPWSARPAAC